MTSVLVLGGYGAVGAHLVTRLRADGVDALAAGRDPARADRVVDLADPASLTAALDGVSAVVNCVGAEDPAVAAAVAERGIPFVDITATSEYAQQLERVEGPVLLGVGIAPGLSSLLAAEAARAGGPVDVLIGLGAGESHGPAATAWTYGLLGKRFDDPDGSQVRNYTRPRQFDLPAEAGYPRFPALRTDFADQHRLTAMLGVPVRSYLKLDSRLATLGLAALTWAPRVAALVPAGGMPGGDGWVIAARGGDGRSLWATGRGQSQATAVVAALAVQRVLRSPIAAPTWLHETISLDELRPALSEAGIALGTE
ncbi:NADH(P)-binding family protein [Rhodococcus sp. MTM3W5.2]|uniref:NAD-dependent epimerase/dehydratase family protein n=1 Tax=Rhodococcus sp. MTM3W5.2 TaxID=1805827 RepID=UPI00097953F6|nr:NAD-dependent epimerase/dehydratase family protein [Rhodococcus sp. MTM3W5.2]AQA24533.1 NADH(P)-binding family protein [Rhodococcus sp. MTM3W5.2]